MEFESSDWTVEKYGDSGKEHLATAQKLLGSPYLEGGESPKGFDCSGFAYYVYQQNGLTIPRSSQTLFQDGQPGPNQYGENPKGIQVIGGQTFQGGQNTGTTGGYQGGYSGGHNNPTTNYSSTENPSNSGGYKDGDLYK